jgi:hypothetical protein
MAVVRRFLLASSLARLLQREGGPADRLVEAYFPARSDRTQLVRVERDRASLMGPSTRCIEISEEWETTGTRPEPPKHARGTEEANMAIGIE